MNNKMTLTLGYENIPLSSLFLERVETDVRVKERQGRGKENTRKN